MLRKHKQPFRIAAIYLVLGVIWVYVSTRVLYNYFPQQTHETFTLLQIVVRLAFVLLSAAILFLLIVTFNKKLQRKYDEYTQLFEDNPNPMWVYELETFKFLAVNQAAIDSYGYSREEFLSKTIKEIRPLEDLSRLINSVNQPHHKFYSSGNWRHLKKDGTLIWVEISSTPVSWNKKRAELVLSYNVTQRVKYEHDLEEFNTSLEEKIKRRTLQLEEANKELATLNEELVTTNEELLSTNDQLISAQNKILEQADGLVRQSRDKLNRIVATIKDMVWSGIIKKNGKVNLDFINQAASDIYGYPISNFYQDHNLWFQRILEEDRPRIEKVNHALVQNGYAETEYRIRDNNNNIKFLFVRIWKQSDLPEVGMRVHGISTDITTRKLQEEEKAKLMDELVNQNNDLLQFSFIASHNLRGPVATLLGLLALIEKEENTNDHLAKLITYAHNAVSKLDEVIKDLSKVLEVRSHDYQPKEVVDLNGLFNTIQENLAFQIHSSKAEIRIDVNQSPMLYSIKNYLHSIFYNLISNAIKYRSPNKNPFIDIKGVRTENKIIFTIKDNGIGIDLSLFRNKIFTLYQRFHTHVEGKGFGLYLVKTQVQALQGSIEIESKPNEGTIFTIHLPILPILGND